MYRLSKRLAGLLATLAIAVIGAPALAADEWPEQEDDKDVLAKAKAKGIITACADPYAYPYSLQNADPPGFDVEIMRSVAKRGGMRLDLFWVNTASRGGTARAFRNSIFAKKCDVFLGLSDNGEDDMLMNKLVFTRPYLGMGYVLVTQGKATGIKSIEEAKSSKMKLGVSMSTPMDDWLFTHEVPRELYMDNRRMMQGLEKGEVDAGMLWSTSIGLAPVEFPKAQFKVVEGFVPMEGLRFNATWAVRKADKSLLAFIDEGIAELEANGRIRQIVESYGVPYFPPF